ncbi:hypothetical protein ACLOAU_04435 [Niabella sp. CJ426]|uniref:hypothetical protein n=1 Tax=Niabella sp. CJ426 TaxID=3393740 RepID=UPI003D08B018
MMTFDEVIVLRDKLSSGEIDLAFAQEQYWKDYKEGQKSWDTKDWKERRVKVLKDKCEICSSTEVLTIQHRSHPKKYSEYTREVTRKYTNEYVNTNSGVDKNEFSNYVINNYKYIPVPLCPNCKNSNPYKRVRKTPHYRCTSCKHEFDTPVYRSIEDLVTIFFQDDDALEVRDKCFVSKNQWKNRNNLSSIRYWLQREQATQKDDEKISKEAFLLYLTDSIKYLSFEDTITACKKCAFNYDIKRMELCPKCKEYYKGIEYPTCIQCLPEEKRKAAYESIEFGKQWHQMHKDLGIE